MSPLTSNFIAGLNRGQITMDIQQGAQLSVGGNFLLGQHVLAVAVRACSTSDITATVAGNVAVTGSVRFWETNTTAIRCLPIFLLDVTSGTLTTENIAFAPNGDLAAFLSRWQHACGLTSVMAAFI